MCPFWRISQRHCIFVSKARMVTLWVSKTISWLQRTSLECFRIHQNTSWPLFMQGKSTFSRQKVDWKSEISDDPLEFIDFVRWRMGFLYWLVDIMCWLCGYVKASPDFNEQVWSTFESIWEVPDLCYARKINFYVGNFQWSTWIHWFCSWRILSASEQFLTSFHARKIHLIL